MDGLGRAIGAGTPFRIGGLWLLCQPLTLEAIACAENMLLAERRERYEVLNEARKINPTPSDVYRELFERVCEEIHEHREQRVVSAESIRDWFYSQNGIGFSAWWSLRGQYPDFSEPESAYEFLVKHEAVAKFVKARDVASGTDLLSELDWPVAMKHPKTGKRINRPAPKFIPWKRTLLYFAKEFGWGPDQVKNLTLHTIRIYTLDEDDQAASGGTAKVDRADEKKLRTMTPEQRREYLKNRR